MRQKSLEILTLMRLQNPTHYRWGCCLRTPQFVTFSSITSQQLPDAFPVPRNEGFTAPFLTPLCFFKRQIQFTTAGARKAPRGSHLSLTQLPMLFTWHTNPSLRLPRAAGTATDQTHSPARCLVLPDKPIPT